MTYEELMSVLRDKNNQRYPDFVLQDLDGNKIDYKDLHVLDAVAILDWPVEKILVEESGLLTITLNGGNFKSWHMRNVY